MKNIKDLPVIGISMGDPAGIGPEVLVKALNSSETNRICRPVIIGDSGIISRALRLLRVKKELNIIRDPGKGKYIPGIINVIDESNIDIILGNFSSPTVKTGKAMLRYILKGTDLALNRDISALVTCPVTKTGLKLAGSEFHGHTELIADRTGTENYAMMLAGRKLKVILVTVHIPLSEVSSSLDAENIARTIRLADSSLKSGFGIKNPRIAVAGLNPHAGEASMFGREEEDIISPAVRLARREGYDIHGPKPPDTVFFHAARGVYDAVVCMYHDQGLIPFKMIHFKDGVNTTLGLPVIRTSVDHGTAYDIAWQGIADPSSLIQAIKMGVFQALNKERLNHEPKQDNYQARQKKQS